MQSGSGEGTEVFLCKITNTTGWKLRKYISVLCAQLSLSDNLCLSLLAAQHHARKGTRGSHPLLGGAAVLPLCRQRSHALHCLPKCPNQWVTACWLVCIPLLLSWAVCLHCGANPTLQYCSIYISLLQACSRDKLMKEAVMCNTEGIGAQCNILHDASATKLPSTQAKCQV